jgi:hypothetical protein
MLLLVLLCACLSAGAEGKKINLIFIGGDADVEDGPNNTFRNLLLHHEDLQENAEHFFIKSTMRDYTNKTAQIHTGEAEAYLSPEAVNVVCGYSHGGQSVFFMNMDIVSDVWLFDACVSIGGKCSDPKSNGRVWAEWIVETAKKGVNLHIFASKGKHNEPSGAKNAIKNLEKVPETDPSVISPEEGVYIVRDENGNEIACIETAVLEGTHKDICVITEDRVAESVYAILQR